MNNKTLKVIIIVSVIIAFLSFFKNCYNNYNKYSSYLELKDSLIQYRNELNEQVSINRSLSISYEGIKRTGELKDSIINSLKKEVNKRTVSIGYSKTVSNTKASTGTTITKIDTVFVDTCNNLLYPTYKTEWDNKWETGVIIASKDSIFRDIKIRNEFITKTEFSRVPFWKTPELTISLVNKNPNTETVELKQINITPPKPKRGLYFIGGAVVGIGSITTLILLSK